MAFSRSKHVTSKVGDETAMVADNKTGCKTSNSKMVLTTSGSYL
jgi:hypothetical protein